MLRLYGGTKDVINTLTVLDRAVLVGVHLFDLAQSDAVIVTGNDNNDRKIIMQNP